MVRWDTFWLHSLDVCSDATNRNRYHGNGTAPISDSTTFQLPSNLWCDGVQWKCVLQFRYQTGNTCTPNGTPIKFANRHLPGCATSNSMEQFWCVS